jgi:hypothetical protein
MEKCGNWFEMMQCVQEVACKQIRRGDKDCGAFDEMKCYLERNGSLMLLSSEMSTLVEFIQFSRSLVAPTTAEEMQLQSILRENTPTQHELRNKSFRRLHLAMNTRVS